MMNRFSRIAALWLILGSPAFATQATLVTPGAPLSMTGLASFVNAAMLSIGSCNSGNSAPTNGPGPAAFAGECWINTTANPWVFSYTPDGTHWSEFGTLNTSTFVWTPYSNGFSASLGGNLSTAGAFTQAGAFSTTITSTAATNSTMPAGTHTLAGLDVSQTFSGTNNFTGPFQINGSAMTFPGVAATLAYLAGNQTYTGNDTFSGTVNHTGPFQISGTAQTFPASGALLGVTDTQTPTNKTFVCANQISCVVRIGTDVSGLGTGIATALSVNVGSAGAPVVNGGALGTPSSGVGTNLTGTASGLTAGNVTTNANLTGDVTSSGNATTLTNAPVIAKVLTGFTSGAGTVTAADSILTAIQKVYGNQALYAPLASPTFTGIPAAPTASLGTNTTQIATTAFVEAAVGAAGGGSVSAGSGGIVPTSGTPSTLFIEQMNPGGRVTLASGVPVMSTSQTAATSVYYAPYAGKYVPIYNGTNMQLYAFTSSDTDTVGLTLALGSNWAANTNFDVFAYQTGGTVSLGTGPDWSQGAVAGSNAVSASSRGTGAGSTQLQLFKGFLTNQNSMTLRTSNSTTVTCGVNQCTYLGSFRTIGTAGQVSFTYGTLDTAGLFNLWNAYNQAWLCSTSQYDFAGAGSWAYSSATIRQANASALNEFNFMTGLAGGSFTAQYQISTRLAASAGANANIGVALDSTTTLTNNGIEMRNPAAAIIDMPGQQSATFKGVLGPHFISANEAGDGSTSTTFIGTFSAFNACGSF